MYIISPWPLLPPTSPVRPHPSSQMYGLLLFNYYCYTYVYINLCLQSAEFKQSALKSSPYVRSHVRAIWMGFCAVPVDSQVSKGHILKDIVGRAKPNRRALRWVPTCSCLFLEPSLLPPPHRVKLLATPESTCFLHLSPATGTPSSLAHRQISSFYLVSVQSPLHLRCNFLPMLT